MIGFCGLLNNLIFLGKVTTEKSNVNPILFHTSHMSLPYRLSSVFLLLSFSSSFFLFSSFSPILLLIPFLLLSFSSLPFSSFLSPCLFLLLAFSFSPSPSLPPLTPNPPTPFFHLSQTVCVPLSTLPSMHYPFPFL